VSRIATEDEYMRTRQTLEEWRASGARLRASLEAAGLSPDHIELAMAAHLTMQDQMEGELAWYENARKGKIRPLPNLTRIGLSLIALRLARGLTQRQLAERLGVNEAQVSKDEKNEYHGISVERAQRIIDALEGSVTVTVSSQPHSEKAPDLVPAR
jgi:DNA-binding XRE family transcriptional regulator